MISFGKEAQVKFDSAPGATFTIAKLNFLARIERDAAIKVDSDKHDDLLSEARWLLRDKPTAEERQKAREAARYAAEIRLSRIIPHTIKAGLVKVDGLEIDGKSIVTADDILNRADDDVIFDLYRACDNAASFIAEQQKNSSSLGTSSPPVTPPSESTTVVTAS